MTSHTMVKVVGGWALAGGLSISLAAAQNGNSPGVTDNEIRIGNIMPYSGPASAYSSIGRVQEAYFRKINDEGGINGRKLKFISYDDGYSPPKAVEQARKLVENDDVLLIFSPLGTPSNTAIQKYLNSKKVPQLFVATGTAKFGDPKSFPWTMGWQPSFHSEGGIYAKYVLSHYPDSKIAVLWQGDDFGRDTIKGLREGLGDRANMIVADKSYEINEPTIDSHVVSLRQSGANIFVSVTAPKAAAQAIKKAAEIGWKPIYIQGSGSASVATVLQPAGLDNSKGLISTAYLKDPTDPTWKDDPGTKAWSAFMDKYFPEGDKANVLHAYGYALAETLVQVLRQCRNELSRENVMKQAASLKDFRSEMMLPGITANTSQSDFFPIQQMQMMQFDGSTWRLFGEVIELSTERR
jgi:ABC-type branched-subunit amino acid transport system substrate-binding protein